MRSARSLSPAATTLAGRLGQLTAKTSLHGLVLTGLCTGLIGTGAGCRSAGVCECEGPAAYPVADTEVYGDPGRRCRCKRPCDFPCNAIPAPPGTYVDGWNAAMIDAGNVDEFLVAKHHWYQGGGELGPEGRRHIAAMSPKLLQGVQAVMIEDEEPAIGYDQKLEEALEEQARLNEERRVAVVAELLKNGVADADARVSVVRYDRVGTRGVEAPNVYRGLIYGGGGGFGGGLGNGAAGGGFGGGGFGGGGVGGGGGFGGGGFY